MSTFFGSQRSPSLVPALRVGTILDPLLPVPLHLSKCVKRFECNFTSFPKNMKLTAVLFCVLAVTCVMAQNDTTTTVSAINDGDTSWLLASSALVFFMTPGLA
jgi:hypothetical protein